MKLTKDAFASATFKICWEYEIKNKTIDDQEKHDSVGEFQIDWSVKSNTEGKTMEVMDGQESKVTWKPVTGVAKYGNIFLIRIVNLVHQAHVESTTIQNLVTEALNYKSEMVRTGSLKFEQWCENGEIKDEYKVEVMEGFMQFANFHGGHHIKR